jgi:hypothetical protein
MICSLFLGEITTNQDIYVELSDRIIAITGNKSFAFRGGFVAIIMVLKVLISIRYRLTRRGDQLSSLQTQTKLPLFF